MKHLSIIALAVGCMISTVEARAVDWKTPGSIRSAAADQQFLLYFHSKDSPLCRELDEDVWSDPIVTQASGDFMPVTLDCGTPETKPMLARFQVYRVPTLVIGRRDGSVVRRLERASEKDTILKFLRGEPIPVAVADSGGKSAPSGAGATLGEASDPAGDANPAVADIQNLKVSRKGDDLEVAVTLAPAASGGVFSTQTLYINTDNASNTGFASSVKPTGAEYMIQGGALFHFNGQKPEDWAWEQKGPVATRIEGSKIVYVIPYSAIGKLDAGFSLFVSTQNEKWDALDWAPDSAPLVAGTPAASAPKQEAPTACSNGDEKRLTDPKGDAAPEFDITGLAYSSNRETVTVSLELANPAGGGIAHVFIDPDADASTGYGDGIRNGADFMIEGALLYRHESAGWNWKAVGEVKPTVDGNRVTFVIPRSRVGLDVSKPGRYWFTITDKAWAPADFIPDNDTITIP